MPNLLHRRHRCLIAVFFAFAGLLGQGALAAGKSQHLSGDTIKKMIPGAILQLDTPLGSVVPVSYGADGTLAGHAGAVAFFLGSTRDSGRWWVTGSKLCHKWKIWFKSEPQCIVLRRRGKKIAWRDDEGETGTATFVARRTPARSRPARAKTVRIASLPPPPKRTRGVKTPSVKTPSVKARRAKAPAARSKTVRASTIRALALKPTPIRASALPRPGKRPPTSMAATQISAWTPRPPAARAVGRRARAARLSPTYRTVRMRDGDVLNIRTSPDMTAPVVGTIPRGAGGIRIISFCKGYWCPIVYARRAGWVNRAFLAFDKPGAMASRLLTYRVVRVRGDDVLNVRSAPFSTAPLITVIPPGAGNVRLTHDCTGEWCRIVHRGRTGWANRTYLAPTM